MSRVAGCVDRHHRVAVAGLGRQAAVRECGRGRRADLLAITEYLVARCCAGGIPCECDRCSAHTAHGKTSRHRRWLSCRRLITDGKDPIVTAVVVPGVVAVIENHHDGRGFGRHRVGVGPDITLTSHGHTGDRSPVTPIVAVVDVDVRRRAEVAARGVVVDRHRLPRHRRERHGPDRAFRRAAIADGGRPVQAVAAIDGGTALEPDDGAGRVLRCVDRVVPDISATGHGVTAPSSAVIEADLHGDRREAFQRAISSGVGHGDRFAVARIGRELRAGGRYLPIILDKDVLDFRATDIAPRVGGLDVIVEEVVAEVRNDRIVDLGEIVIRHLDARARLEVVIIDKEIDLPVVGRGIERRPRCGQDALGHGNGDPLFDIAAAGVGFVVRVFQRAHAVFVAPDFQIHTLHAGDVVNMRPDVKE